MIRDKGAITHISGGLQIKDLRGNLVDLSGLPDGSIPAAAVEGGGGLGGVEYAGTWDATTNSPALATGIGTKGQYYVVSVAGTTPLNGIAVWSVGDWAIFNGTAWEKVDNQSSGGGAPLPYDATVGATGADYTTVQLALAAGKRSLLIVANVTETGIVVLPAAPVRVRFATDLVWSAPYQFDCSAGVIDLSVEGVVHALPGISAPAVGRAAFTYANIGVSHGSDYRTFKGTTAGSKFSAKDVVVDLGATASGDPLLASDCLIDFENVRLLTAGCSTGTLYTLMPGAGSTLKNLVVVGASSAKRVILVADPLVVLDGLTLAGSYSDSVGDDDYVVSAFNIRNLSGTGLSSGAASIYLVGGLIDGIADGGSIDLYLAQATVRDFQSASPKSITIKSAAPCFFEDGLISFYSISNAPNGPLTFRDVAFSTASALTFGGEFHSCAFNRPWTGIASDGFVRILGGRGDLSLTLNAGTKGNLIAGYSGTIVDNGANNIIDLPSRYPLNLTAVDKAATALEAGTWLVTAADKTFTLPASPASGTTFTLASSVGKLTIAGSGGNTVNGLASINIGPTSTGLQLVFIAALGGWNAMQRALSVYIATGTYQAGDIVRGPSPDLNFYTNISGANTGPPALAGTADWKPLTATPQYLESSFTLSTKRLYTGAVTGTPQVGATLLQAVSGATGIVTAINDSESFNVGTITGTFDATNLVTGTNGDMSTFTFTPPETLIDAWALGLAAIVQGFTAFDDQSNGALVQRAATRPLVTGDCRFRKDLGTYGQLETLASDANTTIDAILTGVAV